MSFKSEKQQTMALVSKFLQEQWTFCWTSAWAVHDLAGFWLPASNMGDKITVRTVIIIASFFLTYCTPVQVAYETVASLLQWDTKYRLSYLHAFQSALFCFLLAKIIFYFFFLVYYNMHHVKLVLISKHCSKQRLHRELIFYRETPFQLFALCFELTFILKCFFSPFAFFFSFQWH